MGYIHRHIANFAGYEIDESKTKDGIEEKAELWVYPKIEGTGVWSYHLDYQNNKDHALAVLEGASYHEGWQCMFSMSRRPNPVLDAQEDDHLRKSMAKSFEKAGLQHTCRIAIPQKLKSMEALRGDPVDIPMYQGEAPTFSEAVYQALFQLVEHHVRLCMKQELDHARYELRPEY